MGHATQYRQKGWGSIAWHHNSACNAFSLLMANCPVIYNDSLSKTTLIQEMAEGCPFTLIIKRIMMFLKTEQCLGADNWCTTSCF